MKTWLTVVALLLMVSMAAALEDDISVSVLDNGGQYITDKIVITMYEGTKPLEINQTISGYAVTNHAEIDALCSQYKVIKVEPWYQWPVRNDYLRSLVERMYVFTVEEGLDVKDFKDAFLTSADVEFSDFWNLPVPTYIPNDPGISGQWALSRISCFGAWDLIRADTTRNVTISINDTGVYYNHPDLQANMWINGPEDLNNNGIFDNYPEDQGGDLNNWDDDGNGYPDDVVGYDLGQNDPNPAENSPTHGTHVAGCASEVADNNIGGAGPGFWAKLHAAKITNAGGYLTQGYMAIVYAADNGIDIINCSWGSPSYSGGEQNIVNYAYNLGVLIVAAAGNDDYWTPPYLNYPSAYTHVLAVASTDPDDHKSGFSNYGNWVDISAPGSNIYATWSQSSYANLSGTSMSSPITAGAAALIKAQNPSATPDQITNSIMGAADDIDDLNPQYVGQLGAGRLNIHAALGALNYPNIDVLAYELTQTTDDGDGVLNPGESAELAVVLENLWQEATNTVLTLRAPEGITVTDSVTNLGTFPGDGYEMDNQDDPFELTFDIDALPGEYLLTLVITADGPYEVERELTIMLSLAQANFPVTIPDAIESHIMVCDLNGDGNMQILFGCNDSRFYVLGMDGYYTYGWPYEAMDDIRTGPAVGDIDNDGDLEIVVTSTAGDIIGLDHQGDILTGFPISTGGSLFATPSLADLDNDNDLEIIQPNLQTKEICIYHHDGSVFGGWPYVSTQGWYGGAAIGDIDSDDELEIIIGGFDQNIHAFNSDMSEVTGFPTALDNRVWSTPAIGNIDPADIEPEIVVGAYSGSLYLINHDGTVESGWPIDLGTTIKSSPALGDFDNDGTPEIVIGVNDANLYLVDSDGTIFSGFPVELEYGISTSPTIADLDNDGTPDIIIANGSSETFIFAFNSEGVPLRNCPIPTEVIGQVTASTAVWDLDGDGDLEIVAGIQNSGYNLEVIDYKIPSNPANVEWSAFANDRVRSSNYDALGPVSVDEPAPLPSSFSLYQNYPNPFNSNTIIAYSLDTPSKVSLDIFDVLGRRVISLDSGHRDAGIHEIIWTGHNAEGSEVASGIYFYKLSAGEKTSVKRMIYLR